MSDNKPITFVVFFVLVVLIGFFFPVKGYCVPALPKNHTLSQPDGLTFEARQWGDENINGWETKDGFTILFDAKLNIWAYADHDPDGRLVNSGMIVGKDIDPSRLEKKLRPIGKALKEFSLKRHSREIKLSQEVTGVSPITGLAVATAEPDVPPVGVGNIPTILINFNDRATTFSPSDFNALLFGTGNFSMKDYYQEISYGAFSVSAGPGGVVGWFSSANGHNFYGNLNGFTRAATLVKEAVTQADASFDFAPYDQDGDCIVDVVNVIHQGSGTEASGNTSDIWSHRWSLVGAGIDKYITNDACPAGGNIQVNDYVIEPEILSGQIQTIGVFAHEYGHALGLPDLYDTDFSSEGIGNWSLMAGGSWNVVTRSGDRPAHMDAWSKYKLGWITPTQVTGILASEPITQASTSADVYKLLTGTPSSGEYFLVENRQKTGFDAGLPGEGLLVWHIDATVSNNNNECYPSGPSCSTSHYKVALEQADNLYGLEKKLDRGDTGDPYPGSTINLTFDGSSSPNSNLYSGSSSNNVSVTNISTSGSTMTANFTTQTFTLTITKAGTGSGTITSNPAGINCGTDCSEVYNSNTLVTLVATAEVSSTFAGWSGDADCSDGAITMNASKSCTATFNTISNPDFTISPLGSSLIIQQGGSGTTSYTITSVDSFSSPVSFSLTGHPAGVTGIFNPNPVTPPANSSAVSTLTINAGSTVSCSSYNLTITATGGGKTHTSVLTLDVTGCGGLKGDYYNNPDLTGLSLTRTDGNINFDWAASSPDVAIEPDTFSIRWTGRIKIDTNGTYTFTAVTDDGIRLWIDGYLVIDYWQTGWASNNNSIPLTAGLHDIKIEFFENTGDSFVQLYWSSPSLPNDIIPQDHFSPPESSGNAPVLTWTGETGYTSDGLDPQTGNTMATFKFSIRYTDSDGDAPMAGYPRVHILKGGVEITGSPFSMSDLEEHKAIGVVYSYSTLLLEGTDYAHYFDARDQTGLQAVASPAIPTPTVFFYAPDVTSSAEVSMDLDGSGRVDGFDLGRIGIAFGSRTGDPNWNPDADLNGDGVIDGSDLTLFGSDFGSMK